MWFTIYAVLFTIKYLQSADLLSFKKAASGLVYSRNIFCLVAAMAKGKRSYQVVFDVHFSFIGFNIVVVRERRYYGQIMHTSAFSISFYLRFSIPMSGIR